MVESNKANKRTSSARGRSQMKHQPTQTVPKIQMQNQVSQRQQVKKKYMKLPVQQINKTVQEDVKRSLRDMLIIQAIKMDYVNEAEFSANVEKESCIAPSYDLKDVWDDFQQKAMERRLKTSTFAKVIASPIVWKSLTFLVIENQKMQKIFSYIYVCTNLQALFLTGNQIITRDLPYIKHLTQLRKVDLSNNNIHFLPSDSSLENLNKLQFLLLHRNQIVGWHQLDYLLALKQLRLLTCYSNPCTKILGSREHIVEGIPQLWVLDDMIVSDFERKKFQDLDLDLSKVTLIRFYPQSYPFYSMPPPKKNIHKALEDEHYKLRRAYEYTSPILTVQKTWKMWSQKMRYKRMKRQMKILFWAVTRYYKRWFYLKLVYKQKLTLESLKRIGHVRRVQKHWRAFWRKKLLRDIYSVKLQSVYRANREQKLVPIHFYTSDLTLILSETDADKFHLGGEYIPGAYLWPDSNFKHSQSFLLDNIRITIWKIGLRPIHSRCEDAKQSKFSNLKPQRQPRVSKRLKGPKIDLSSQIKQGIGKKISKKIRTIRLVRVSFDSFADLTQRYNMIVKMRNKVTIYPQRILKRVLAAIRIQSWWKGMMARKIIKSIFTRRKKLKRQIDWKNVTLAKTRYYEFVAVLRAAEVIQKFFKSKCLRSRVNTLIAICKHVKQISNEPLYLEQNLYLNLQQIVDKCSQVRLQERKFDYQIIDGVVHMKSLVKRYSKTVLPNWFLEKAGLEIPIIPAYQGNRKDANLLALLHHKSNLTEATVVDSNQLQLDQKIRKFVKFHFKSAQEGKKMACLIALLTCQYIKDPTHFLHLLQQDQIRESEGVIEQLLQDYKIQDQDEKLTLRNIQEQVHNGIINKKIFPYSNILMARPKLSVRDQGLIILTNADPEQVDIEVRDSLQKKKLIRAEEGAVSYAIAEKIELSNYLLLGAHQNHYQNLVESPGISKKDQAQLKQEEEKKDVRNFKIQLLNQKMKDLELKVQLEEKQIQSLETNIQLNQSQSHKLLVVPEHKSREASLLFDNGTEKRKMNPLSDNQLGDDLPITYEQKKEMILQRIKELKDEQKEKALELSRKKFLAGRQKHENDEFNFSHRKKQASRPKIQNKVEDHFAITKEENKVQSVQTVLIAPTMNNSQPKQEQKERQSARKEQENVQSIPEPKSNAKQFFKESTPAQFSTETKSQDKTKTRAQKQYFQAIEVKQIQVFNTPRLQQVNESKNEPLPKIEAFQEKLVEFEQTSSIDQNYNFLVAPHSYRNALPQALNKRNVADKKPKVQVLQTQKSQNIFEIPYLPPPKITIDGDLIPVETQREQRLNALNATVLSKQEKQIKLPADAMTNKKESLVIQAQSMQDLHLFKSQLKIGLTQLQKKIIETTLQRIKVEGQHQKNPYVALRTISPPPTQDLRKGQKNQLKNTNSPNKLVSFKNHVQQMDKAKLLKTSNSHAILSTLTRLQDQLVVKNLTETQPKIPIQRNPKVGKPKVEIPLKTQQILPMFPINQKKGQQGLQANNGISQKINNIKKIRTNNIPNTQKNSPRIDENIKKLMLSGAGNRAKAIPTKTKPGQERKKLGSSGSPGTSRLSDVNKSARNKLKVPDDRKSSIDSFYSEYDSQIYQIKSARLLSATPSPKKATKRHKAFPQNTIEHVIIQRKEKSQKAKTKNLEKIFSAHSERAVHSLMPSKSFLPRIKKGTSLARLQSEIISQQILGEFCRF